MTLKRADESAAGCASKHLARWQEPDVKAVGVAELACPDALQVLVDDYDARGYAWFELGPGLERSARGLLQLTQALHLGQPFVPPLYQGLADDFYDGAGFNVVTGEPGARMSAHPAFTSRSGLELHTDGTLQTIGEIRTSLLFCLEPAAQGGDTLLFDAVGAFQALEVRDARLARALLDERALWRHATVGDAQQAAVGPVFQRSEQRLLARYCTTPRERWAIEDVPGLEQARQALAELSQPDSPYCVQFRPLAGQGVLFANDRLSHGRTPYEDAPGRPRRMLRALFHERPSVV